MPRRICPSPPLRPELVVEVRYDHMEGDRFRHTAQFNRWRPDREPESCTYAQLDEPVSYDLSEVLGTSPPVTVSRHRWAKWARFGRLSATNVGCLSPCRVSLLPG